MAIVYFFNYMFRLSVTKYFWFCKCAAPWMFPPLDILLEYWIEHVTFGFVLFTFPTRIVYKGVPGFETNCPCGFWSIFGNIVENVSRSVFFDTKENNFFLLFHILMPHNMIIFYLRLPHFHVSNSALFFYIVLLYSHFTHTYSWYFLLTWRGLFWYQIDLICPHRKWYLLFNSIPSILSCWVYLYYELNKNTPLYV